MSHAFLPAHFPWPCLQVCGDALGISAVVTAMMGLCVLLLSGVLQWKECLQYPAAWDTLFWFAGE